MPIALLATALAVALLARILQHIPPPTDREGGTYVGRWPDGREFRVHRFVGSGGEPWDHWVDSESGRWASSDPSRGELWGPARNVWGSNAVVRIQLAADGISGMAFRTTSATSGPGPTNNTSVSAVLAREFRHRGAATRFGLQIGRFGTEIEGLAQVPAFDTTHPFARSVSDHLWQEARTALRDFMSQRWEQAWDAARSDWPASLSSWSLDWQAQPRLWRSNLASIAVIRYPQTGGNGDPTHWRGITLLWDHGRIIPLTWDDLFREDPGLMVYLKRRCSDELTRHLDHETVADDIPTDNFTLTTQGLQLLFDPYTVASGADGAQVVHIPWADLRPYLRPVHTTQPGENGLPSAVAELMEAVPVGPRTSR